MGKSAPPPPDYTPLAEANLKAAEIQSAAADRVVSEGRKQYETTRADLAPWREAGAWALNTLQEGVQSGAYDPGSWESFLAELGPVPEWKPFNAADLGPAPEWKPFTADMMRDDPGYQFRLQEGMKGAHRALALTHGRASGATAKALQRYGQDYGSAEFSNARQRAIGDYSMKSAEHAQRYGRRYNEHLTDFNARMAQRGQHFNELMQQRVQRSNELMQGYNALSNIAGTGQVATTQGAQLGTQQVGQISHAINQGAAAQAAGQVGHANAMVQGDVARYNQQMHQNQLNQQGIGNLFGLVGLGLSGAGMASHYGWFGG